MPLRRSSRNPAEITPDSQVIDSHLGNVPMLQASLAGQLSPVHLQGIVRGAAAAAPGPSASVTSGVLTDTTMAIDGHHLCAHPLARRSPTS